MKMIKRPFSGRSGNHERDIGFYYRRKVGSYIRRHRMAAGLTQLQLGQIIGIGNNAISAIELGRNPIPPERYRAFADALGILPKDMGEYLLEHTDPWLFALVYGEEKAAKHNLDRIPDRFSNPNY